MNVKPREYKYKSLSVGSCTVRELVDLCEDLNLEPETVDVVIDYEWGDPYVHIEYTVPNEKFDEEMAIWESNRKDREDLEALERRCQELRKKLK